MAFGLVWAFVFSCCPVLQSQLVQQPRKAPGPPRLSRTQAAREAALAEVEQQKQTFQQQQQQQQQAAATQGPGGSAALGAASGQLSALSGGGAITSSSGVTGQRGATQPNGGQGHAASQAGGAAEVNVGVQPHLQHLLLDALATELIKEDNPGPSVQHLLQ